jgi:hypothetical protein
MKKYTFLNFLYKKEVTEGFLTNLALAGALAGGDTGEIQDFNPQQLKINQEEIKQKHKISDHDSKIFAALKAKGMQEYYITYLIKFYEINKISLNNLNVFNKDIDFYRVLKSGNIVSVFDLNKMKKEKPMTKQEEEVLYDMANDFRNYLRNDAFGFSSPSQNKEIYLPNDLLKIIVFNEKYKLDNNTGLGSISKFLEKHKITWGDIDGMRKVMKNYYDVLENYKKRQM